MGLAFLSFERSFGFPCALCLSTAGTRRQAHLFQSKSRRPERLPALGLASEFARRALHIFFEHGRKVGGTAEAAPLGHFGHVKSRIKQGTLGQFYTPAN